ncbi:MAG: NifU family protein [Candidatus Magnetobacterium sp. LHC-1]|uniref:NifU family protein n=1 Tax=Candidatus Magnetobacterium casense TaxID=1455061 RepID=A0ABS6RW57_9BACT|nr:NifU family protein [Candidatus Magnetobacterium casensis]MBF0606190.1 NifU family protein [Nitrospirota bacterium]MBV6340862.1 NifU family protein [Candidatus Magnetobacterium casensis]
MNTESINKTIEKVREGLKTEGGDIEVIEIRDNVLYVRLIGSCQTCPMSSMTMKNWVEKTILFELPSLSAVKAVQAT